MRAPSGASWRYFAFLRTPSMQCSDNPRLTHREQGLSSPQVRWARWQAKHALRAFFLRGRLGSFASFAAEVLSVAFFWPGEFSREVWRSLLCSAAISSSSSPVYSGEGEASSASGVDIITVWQSLSQLHGLVRQARGGADGDTLCAACSRQWCAWDVPSKTVQPMCNRCSAGEVPAACLGLRSRVRWLSKGRFCGTLTRPILAERRRTKPEQTGVLNPVGRYENMQW